MFGDLSYTGKDIVSIREEIMNYIKEHDPNWTDYNESSLQLQYVDIVSGVVDLMCYYLDNQALENYLSTARQEKNIKNIMRTINYPVKSIGPALGKITVQRSEQEVGTYGDDTIVIPKSTVVYCGSDSTKPKYLTTEETIFHSYDIIKNIPVVQGELKTVTVPNTTVKQSYKLYITDKEVPIDYVNILNVSGETQWIKCEDAFKEIEGGPKYSAHIDSKGRCYILFTFNWKDYVSSEESSVMTIQYIETLGRAGIVDSYTLDTFGPGIYDLTTSETTNYYFKIWNPEPTYGAFDKIDLNKQKANALNWLQTYDRLVTLKDFDTLLRTEPWILDCYVADWRTNGKLVQYPHEARAWIVPVDGDITPDESEAVAERYAELESKIQDKTVIMTSVHIHPAEFRKENWDFVISITGTSDTEKERIRTSLETLLRSRYLLSEYCAGNDQSLLKFNMEIRTSTLEAAIYNFSDTITSIQLPFDEDFRLAENEFLDVQSLTVTLTQ